MKKLLLVVVVVILAFSSCYEDSKPTLNIHFGDSSSQSRNIDLSSGYAGIESIHVAVFNPSNLLVPVAQASFYKGSDAVSTVSLTVPLGPAVVVIWLADGSNVATYYTRNDDVTMVAGTNDISMPEPGSISNKFNLVFDSPMVTWDLIPGATSYTVGEDLGNSFYNPIDVTENIWYNSINLGNIMLSVHVNSSIFGISSTWSSSSVFIEN